MLRSTLRSALLAGVLLQGAIISPSFAAAVVHDGTSQPAAELATYGMQVDAERALRGVLPRGWRATLSPGVTLPGKVSWGPTDNWLAVIDRIATRTSAGILIDWNRQEVLVREMSATLEDATEREKIKQAAVTPLPSLGTSAKPTTVAAPEKLAGDSARAPVSPTLSATSPPAPTPTLAIAAAVTTVAETPSLIAPVASVKDVNPVATITVSAGPARTFNRTAIRLPLEALATRHGLTLVNETGEASLPGAVTLMLGDDLDEDVDLLTRALGSHLPLAITHFVKEHELVVRHAMTSSYAREAARPQPKPSFFARLFKRVPASAPSVSPPVAVPALAEPTVTILIAAATEAQPLPAADLALPIAPPATTELAGPPVTLAVSPKTPVVAELPFATLAPELSGPPSPSHLVATRLALEIAQGEHLSTALERLFRSQGWTLSWRVNVDLEAATPARVEGDTLAKVLEQILPHFGLAADLYTPSRYAVIRAIEPDTASVGTP